jgi:membrane fusion protein, macrolide-specific efflux system
MTLDQIPTRGPGAGGAGFANHEPDEATSRAPIVSHQPWYRRLRRRWLVLSVAVVVIVAFAVWYFAIRSDGSSSNAAATTTTKQLVTVTRGALTNSVSAEGTVAAAQTDDLSFSAAGTVTAVNVKAGDTVTAGEVLATIDSASLQSSVASAASTLARAQASLADDQSSGASSAQIAADQTAVTTATDSLARAWQNLAGASLVATFNGTVSSVNLTVGEQLSSSGSGGTTPTGSGSGSGQSSSTLGSGNSGGFGGNNSSNSSSSSAQIEVVSKGQYSVSLPVASSDVSSLEVGDPATLTVTTATGGRFGGFGGFGGGGGFRALFGAGGGGAGTGGANANGGGRNATGQNGSATSGPGNSANTGATATGTVTDVGQVASASSGVAQYPVTVTFTTDNAQFSVGSTVTGAVQAVVADNVIEVPVRAVSSDANGRSTVTVALDGKTNGRTATRTVQTGRTAGGMVEITSGLKEGDQVIVTTVIPAGLTTNGAGNRGGFGGTGRFPGFGGAGTGSQGSGNAQVTPKGAGG